MKLRVPTMAMAAFLLCANSGCGRSFNASHVATVDSLMLITDSLIKGLNAIDRVALHTIDSTYQLQKDALAARMRDTLDKASALTLGNYHRTMNKSLGVVKKDFDDVMQELERTKEQLANLKNDVAKGLLDPPIESGYLGQESLAVATVRERATRLANSALSVLREHRRLAPGVDSLLLTTAIPSIR